MTELYKYLTNRIAGAIRFMLLFLFLFAPGIAKADGTVTSSGAIQIKTDSSITVNSFEYIIKGSTNIVNMMNSRLPFDSLKANSYVRIEAVSNSNGKLVSTFIRLLTPAVNMVFSGSITAISANSFFVNGMEVFVDSNTVISTQYHAELTFQLLHTGDNVVIKAVQSGGHITAAAVMVITEHSSHEVELSGKIQSITVNSFTLLNTAFYVDANTKVISVKSGLISFSTLKVGDEVSVRGYLRPDSTYLSLYIILKNNDMERMDLEVKGAITAISSASLTVNSAAVKVDSSTVIYSHEGALLNFSDLKIGDIVEVEAKLQSDGTYIASKIEVEVSDSEKHIEISGLIESVGSNNIVVGGITVYINSTTKIYSQSKQNLLLSDLNAGSFVLVKAYSQNNLFYASTIMKRTDNNLSVSITGAIEIISGNTITVKGSQFVTDQNTVMVDNNGNVKTFADLKTGEIVTIKAVPQSGSSTCYAVKITTRNFWRPTVSVEGAIESLTGNSLTVFGKIFLVDSSTIVVGNGVGVISFANLTVGLKVEVKGALNSSGVLTAKIIKVHYDNEYEIHGKIESLIAGSIALTGITIKTDQSTLFYDEFDHSITYDSLKVDQMVEIKYVKTTLNENLAVKVEVESDPRMVQFDGIITSASSANIKLSVPSFTVNSNTVFISDMYMPIQAANIQAGQGVTIWAKQDMGGSLSAVQVQQISTAVTAITNENGNQMPSGYELKQNYPNPFNPTTTIQFNLPKEDYVSLVVYNILGQEVITLINAPMSSGLHVVKFNGINLTSGIYLYKLKAGNYTSVKKMLLLK